MVNIDRRPVSWVAAVALAATLSACSSSGTGVGVGASSNSNTSVSQASASPTEDGTQAASGGSTSGCPSVPAVSAAASTTVSAPRVTKQADTTMCSYPEASGGVIAITDESDAEYSADDVQGALTSQVQALGGDADKVTSVSGIGDAAYEFTQDGLTTLGIVSGSAYWSVIGAPSPAAALALAKLVL